MDENDIHVSVLSITDGRARALGHDLDIDSRVFLEFRKQHIEQPGRLGAGGGGHGNDLVLGGSHSTTQHRHQYRQQQNQPLPFMHLSFF
jgi:hypothetical protein